MSEEQEKKVQEEKEEDKAEEKEEREREEEIDSIFTEDELEKEDEGKQVVVKNYLVIPEKKKSNEMEKVQERKGIGGNLILLALALLMFLLVLILIFWMRGQK